jgi:hypothetical protein
MSYDDYYEVDTPSAIGCYCKINYVCSECKGTYN